jgi:hypothetical protein
VLQSRVNLASARILRSTKDPAFVSFDAAESPLIGASPRIELSTMAEKQEQDEKKAIYNFDSPDGTFKRQISSFRSWISSEPGSQFPPEKGRYVSCIRNYAYRKCGSNLLIGSIHESGMSLGFKSESSQNAEGPRGYYPDGDVGLGTL